MNGLSGFLSILNGNLIIELIGAFVLLKLTPVWAFHLRHEKAYKFFMWLLVTIFGLYFLSAVILSCFKIIKQFFESYFFKFAYFESAFSAPQIDNLVKVIRSLWTLFDQNILMAATFAREPTSSLSIIYIVLVCLIVFYFNRHEIWPFDTFKNKLRAAQYKDKRSDNAKAYHEKPDSTIDSMFKDSLIHDALISVTLKNRKVYIGFVIETYIYPNTTTSIKMLVLASGYRESEDGQLYLKNLYGKSYEAITKGLEASSDNYGATAKKNGTAILVSEIVTVSYLFDDFFEQAPLQD